jgi:hypothetical protein
MEVPPYWALEVKFEMGHPIAHFDQRWPTAGARISELHTVLSDGELDFLLVARLTGALHVFADGASSGSGNASVSLVVSPKTPTVQEMFFTACSPKSANASNSLSLI